MMCLTLCCVSRFNWASRFGTGTKIALKKEEKKKLLSILFRRLESSNLVVLQGVLKDISTIRWKTRSGSGIGFNDSRPTTLTKALINPTGNWPCISITTLLAIVPNIGTDLDTRIRTLLFSSLTFKMSTKFVFFLNFFVYYFLKVHLHHYSQIKSHQEATKK